LKNQQQRGQAVIFRREERKEEKKERKAHWQHVPHKQEDYVVVLIK
jgi:hypothetical protein